MHPPSLTDSLRQRTNTVVSQLAWNAALHGSKELPVQDGEKESHRIEVKVWPVLS